MEDKRLKRVFDQVKLSPEREEAMLADLLNEKKEVSGMKQTNNRHRIPAAALVAAVLVIALAGTAVAASYFGRLDVLPAEGGYENGYHIWGAYQNIPPERLSKELLDYAAQADGGEEGKWTFDSWSEAEEFLGLELADNALLEAMPHEEWEPHCEYCLGPKDVGRCTIETHFSLGLPDVISLSAGYFEDEYADFCVNVFAYLRVKGAEKEDVPFGLGSEMNLKNAEAEEYVTPGGLKVTIIATEYSAVSELDGAVKMCSAYNAYFTLNDAMFWLRTDFNEENAAAILEQLKQVLDAYE